MLSKCYWIFWSLFPKNLISHLCSDESRFSERLPRVGHKLTAALKGVCLSTEHTQRPVGSYARFCSNINYNGEIFKREKIQNKNRNNIFLKYIWSLPIMAMKDILFQLGFILAQQVNKCLLQLLIIICPNNLWRPSVLPGECAAWRVPAFNLCTL